MPHSLVLNMVPKSPIFPNYLTGRHLHALFLTLVSSVDKPLGDRLHQSTSQKAFTISPLQTPKRPKNLRDNCLQWHHNRPIPANSNCWWRISLLDDGLFGELTALWLDINPQKPWHLGPADLQITSIMASPKSSQPWANSCSYSQLYENASDTNRAIALSFATPTSFRQGKYDTAMPSRESVFNSLLKRWNKYSGIEFSELPVESIFSSYLDINTEIVADSRSKFIGVVGNSTYRIMGKVEPIFIKQINALADFALYCGVGRKTPMGMGMTRRLFINN
ncbi:MAG: CRISPR-associated endoribonuclease Cas6 [Cyanobacteriota bacterium]|nr:CRISPR-associated endoribonuclease Cas6 [Cyanobacteriota bacterium]